MGVERKEIELLMREIFTSNEAAEYLNISTQRLNQLVHEGKLKPVKTSKSIMLFLRQDLDQRKVTNITSNTTPDSDTFNIDTQYIRDAILFYTIEQYFNFSDKKTSKFIDEITNTHSFDYRAGLKQNIRLLSSLLKISENQFYDTYTKVKTSFQSLPNDVILIKKGDGIYPNLLLKTEEAPAYLFLKGDISLLNEKSICVVGSRNASNESLKKTEALVKSLIKRNIVVNAGLAKGIDTATHNTALYNGGKTIAVIGTPINQFYPKENKDLQVDISKKGLLVSQFPPCNPVNRWNFPTRNGVMSGISVATVIMEAGETSGALKQADYALKQGRTVLIPKSAVDSSLITWPKKYIERGAHQFANLKEVLQTLNGNDVLKNLFDKTADEEIEDVEMD